MIHMRPEGPWTVDRGTWSEVVVFEAGYSQTTPAYSAPLGLGADWLVNSSVHDVSALL